MNELARQRLSSSWLFIGMFIVPIAQASHANDSEPSPAAQKAIDRASEAFQKNYEGYAKANAKIYRDAERDLEREIERLTKAGDLQAALRVKAVVQSLPQLQARAENGGRQDGKGKVFQPTMRRITWAELQAKPQVKPGVPARAVASSTHPGNWGTGNALDGNRDTDFAFLGGTGSIFFEFAPPVECSAVVFESRRGVGDNAIRGAIQINGKYTFPIQNFGGGAILAFMLGEDFPVNRIQFVSEQGSENPGIAEIYFLK
jgi:hypothetical protein